MFFTVLGLLAVLPTIATISGQEPDKPIRVQTLDPVMEPPAPPHPLSLTAQEHPWGRFALKTWVCMQTVTWTHQEDQQTMLIRDSKTTLDSVDKDGVTLKTTTTVHAGGRRIETAPTTYRFDFYQQPIREKVRIDGGGEGKLAINNMIVPCKKRIYDWADATEKQKTVVWYSTQLYPYVLRIESVLSRLPTEAEPEEKILRRSVSEVLESSSFHLRWSKDGDYRMRTRKTDGNVTTVVESTCSRYVPGGIVRETVRDFDATGKEIRTVETKLINYHCAASEDDNPELSPGFSHPFYELPMPRRMRWRRMPPMTPMPPF